MSAKAPAGMESGTSTARAIAKLLNHHVANEYSRDMMHILSCKQNQKAKDPRIRSSLPILCHRRISWDVPDSSHHAEIDAPYAVIIDQQSCFPCEQTRLLRHLRRDRDPPRFARRDRDGQTARNRACSVLRPANQTYRMIRPIDYLECRIAHFFWRAGANIDQARIQGDSFAAKMGQGSIRRTVLPIRQTGE